MNGHILGISTAVPKHSISQNEALNMALDVFSLEASQQEQMKKVFQNSGIEKRHIVTPELKKDRKEWHFWGQDYPKTIPGMTERNEMYKKESLLLAHEAAEKAIQAWGGDPATLTHVISVSCTGVVIPGIDFLLIDSLGLKRSISRLGINFMGCFGAFKGLEVAQVFAKENSKNRILVVCTELCSLHLQADLSPDTIVANSIFADGAAAVVVGSHPSSKEKPLWEIVKSSCFGLEETGEHMSWEASNQGFLMRLSGAVPLIISRHIQKFANELQGSHTNPAACNWAIHPGGRAILQVIEKKMRLEKSQTQASWDTLKNYGNMSSATFLFVLDNLSKQKEALNWTTGIGFGPGLSMEGILLKGE